MESTKKQPIYSVSLIFIIGYFCLISQLSLAKNSTIFRGRVVDSSTQEALQYATISIPDKGFGLITNRFGEFALNIPAVYHNENVQLSFIGYKSKSVAVSSIISDSIYSFQLEPQINNLSEITIERQRIMPSNEMVKKAIQNIPLNYPQKPFRLHAFYRDYSRNVKTEDYDNLIEAAVLVNDRGFETINFLNTTFELEQLRFHPGFSIDTTLGKGYSSRHKTIPFVPYEQENELVILLGQDPIRNSVGSKESFIPLFDLDFVSNYTFRYNACFETDSVTLYEIDFSAVPQLKTDKKAEFQIEGKLYIEDRNYALVKLFYKVNCSLPNYEGKFIDIKIEYKKDKDDYFLNYITACNFFEMNAAGEGDPQNLASYFYPKKNQYFQYRELFVNEVERRPYKEIKNSIGIDNKKSLLCDSIRPQRKFWEKYNFPQNLKLLE